MPHLRIICASLCCNSSLFLVFLPLLFLNLLPSLCPPFMAITLHDSSASEEEQKSTHYPSIKMSPTAREWEMPLGCFSVLPPQWTCKAEALRAIDLGLHTKHARRASRCSFQQVHWHLWRYKTSPADSLELKNIMLTVDGLNSKWQLCAWDSGVLGIWKCKEIPKKSWVDLSSVSKNTIWLCDNISKF